MLQYREFIKQNIKDCEGSTPQQRMVSCGKKWRIYKDSFQDDIQVTNDKPKRKPRSKKVDNEPPMTIHTNQDIQTKAQDEFDSDW
jgi:hypothetical protein